MSNKLAHPAVIALLLLTGSIQAAGEVRQPRPYLASGHPTKITPRQIWCARPPKTLKNNLDEWAKRAGWAVQWEVGHDYPILATTCFNGSFVNALQAISQAYQEAETPLYWDLYLKQRLVVITP